MYTPKGTNFKTEKPVGLQQNIQRQNKRQQQIYQQVTEAPQLQSSDIDRKQILIQATERLKILKKQKRLDEAPLILEELHSQKVSPDTLFCTTLLDAFVKNNQAQLAYKIFKEVFGESNSLKPDEIVFQVLIKGFAQKKPPEWENIENIIMEMQKTYNIGLSVGICNQLLSVCVNTGNLERGTEVIQTMQRNKIEPDISSFQITNNKRVLRSQIKKLGRPQQPDYIDEEEEEEDDDDE